MNTTSQQDRAMSQGVIDLANLTLRIQRELVSPNQWNGRHWRVKHRISQDWEKALGGALLDVYETAGQKVGLVAAIMAMAGPKWAIHHQPGVVRVTITREVPSARNFIRDDDNLRFSVKPLLDALKRQGYIKNDSRKWIELPTPAQAISADGKHWTMIHLETIEQPAAKKIAPQPKPKAKKKGTR